MSLCTDQTIECYIVRAIVLYLYFRASKETLFRMRNSRGCFLLRCLRGEVENLHQTIVVDSDEMRWIDIDTVDFDSLIILYVVRVLTSHARDAWQEKVRVTMNSISTAWNITYASPRISPDHLDQRRLATVASLRRSTVSTEHFQC